MIIGHLKYNEPLGMILDSRLQINDYVDTIQRKKAKVAILSRIKRFFWKTTAIRIYKYMIRPHFNYIDIVLESGSMD